MLLLPSAADGQGTAVARALTSASALCQVEPVGRWFEAFVKRRNRNASASFQELEDKKELSEESEDEELQLEEFPMLKTLDPKDWKNQDHYAVLGLGHVRYKATQRQIKAAHKAMVLKHHPDKRKAAGEPIKEGDNDYFTCITKAYEMLSDPVKRRAFNSIDPTFDNSVPSKSEAKDNFFEVFSPVFERNSRWSNKKNVPKLGDMSSSFEDVDAFYSFWYNFDSWREFSYLDEEEKEKAEWYQRQAELEAARLAKEKEEEEVRQQALLAKKEKDIQKKAIKKERQKLRNSCKAWNHFSDNEAERVRMMEEVEKLCDRLELASLQCLNETLTSSTREGGRAALEKQIEEINEQIRKEKEEAEARMRQASKNAEKSTGGGGSSSKNWSEDDLQLLIKAVNLFPAGTNSRWEVIANYMNIHSSSDVKRTAKDVIGKAKSLQKLDPHQKDDINRKAFDKFRKEHGVVPQADNATPSERFEGPCTDFTPWTTEEQKLLEQALKTYPVNTPERWEKIAEAVPGRTKKDCMKRYKELVEMVKAKKAAQEQVLNASRARK
ncbi:dnaJ homolog subfamily C member 2 [Octodon degus]|uniref:DnaJ homolog subfamily C member 2 n=1 Tax=Octodon degus TaxID=10160 RepID=A0A6P3FK43_OCTDE|nr:dnaJ homolog subfamily C member 2 [Octodon degus]